MHWFKMRHQSLWMLPKEICLWQLYHNSRKKFVNFNQRQVNRRRKLIVLNYQRSLSGMMVIKWNFTQDYHHLQFCWYFQFLQPYLPKSQTVLTHFKQCILVLQKLRLNLTMMDLACRFNVSRATVSRIYIDMIDITYASPWWCGQNVKNCVKQCQWNLRLHLEVAFLLSLTALKYLQTDHLTF